ncbi:hypothetical protein MW887_008827 [Aspergillus wentii]|nr:hypothetical protein MW887_008827 [Aspergillus wentii]
MDSLKEIIYTLPSPPPRTRTKPLTLICVGPPRSATESLSVALTQLSLKTYHGWDLVFEEDAGHIQSSANLAQRKFSNQGVPDGDVRISRAEFDAILGDVDAVIDLPASIFAAELIAAYPEAKVIINTRRDLDAWRTSVLKTIVGAIEDKWSIWLLSIFSTELYWTWEATMHYGIPGLFRSTSIRKGVVDNGKWIYREHCNMVRGLVSDKERLLEWSVEDGWVPLCKVSTYLSI